MEMFTRELEYFLDATNLQLKLLKETVCIAKDIVNISNRKSTSGGIEKSESIHLTKHQNETKGQMVSEEELSLENEIRRVLQVAEKVRNSSNKNQLGKSGKTKSIDIRKGKDLQAQRTKSLENITTEKGAVSKSTRRTIVNNDSGMKSTYQKDFSLKRVKILKKPLEDKVEENNTSERFVKKNLQPLNPAKQGFRSSKGNKSPTTQDTEAADNKKLSCFALDNASLLRKEEPSPNSSDISLQLNSAVLEESFLSEEILMKSQDPQFGDVLRLLRECYTHLDEAKRTLKKDEIKLKDNFLKKYNLSEGTMQKKTHEDLDSVLRDLLPYCHILESGCESLSDSVLKKVKDITIKIELVLKNTIDHNEGKEIRKPFGHQNFHLSESNSEDSQVRSKSYSDLWNPPFLYPILKEMEELPFFYYTNLQEWLSFENSLLESQECYLQQKILGYLCAFIAGYFSSRGGYATVEEIQWRDSLAFVLKTLVTVADFSGNLSVPLLACLKKPLY